MVTGRIGVTGFDDICQLETRLQPGKFGYQEIDHTPPVKLGMQFINYFKQILTASLAP